MKKLSGRIWFSLLLIGLVGQFAWTIENMYFNVFLYNTISQDPDYIAAMVAGSAIVATLTTLLIGALSDRAGRRKPFICGGYILWGFSTMAFGFINIESSAALFGAANAATAAAVAVILMDCIMTFFGSSANDAAFNAYITDVTESENRGRVESVLATLPLLSMLIIFGLFDGMTQRGEWSRFFLSFGIAVTLTGILSIFLLKESDIKKTSVPFIKSLSYGFRPSVIKNNKKLYLALLSFAVFNIAVQVFFPYLIIYMQHYLEFEAYALVLGVVLLLSGMVSVLCGKWIDKAGKLKFALPAGAAMLIGLAGMYFVRSMEGVMIAGTIMMSGYMLLTAVFSGTVRDYTPSDKVGMFQGIRMIFAVMLPMVTGPAIGAAVIKNSGMSYEAMGEMRSVPTPGIFLAAAIVLLIVILPIKLLKKEK